MPPIKYHVCIPGFTQGDHGLLSLREKLLRDGHQRDIDSRVEMFSWRHDWSNYADVIERVCEIYRRKASIRIYAYSFGAGWGAMQLAKELRKRAIPVRAMVLCDPVFRHPFVGLRWLSLLPGDSPLTKIRVPDNVSEVWSFFQRLDRPQGHRLIATNGTLLHSPLRLYYPHVAMDNADEFHARSLEVARLDK